MNRSAEGGKKADLTFVQHMLAVLKHDGRLATIMPHGVVFRDGAARKHFIDNGPPSGPTGHIERLS